MGRVLHRNQPCLRCKSSDAVQVYEDGPARCFSCGVSYDYNREYEKKNGGETVWKTDSYRRDHFKKSEISLEDIIVLPVRGIRERLITKEVAEFYGVRSSYNDKGEIERFFFPFSNVPGVITGYKTKNPIDKPDMYTTGDTKTLFGLEHFQNGGRKIIITEGEEDAMAVAQASLLKYKSIYPSVSMGSSTQTAYLLKNRETLRKFEEIILWFDNDEAGQKGANEAAKILGADKVKIVRSNEKDACEVLKQHGLDNGTKKIWSYIFDAKSYSPAGVLAGEATWDKYKEFQNLVYVPWPPFLSSLNDLTFGRALGTITMFAAGTGIGKSTLLKEDFLHLMNTTDAKVGACFLEEDVGETVSGIIGMHLNKRIGLPNVEVTEEEERKAWEDTVGKTGRSMFIDHQGSVSDDSLLDKIEFLILSGCSYVYLDHITIAISDADDNVNAAIDKFMSGLLKIVKKYKAWIGVVSHLRKVKSGEDSFESGAPISEDDLKGSGSLKQISFQTIAISRNKSAENEAVRNKSRLYLLKDRKTGNSGPAGAYRFDKVTGRLLEVEAGDDTDFELEIV